MKRKEKGEKIGNARNKDCENKIKNEKLKRGKVAKRKSGRKMITNQIKKRLMNVNQRKEN